MSGTLGSTIRKRWGVFFRTPGGRASAFESGIQEGAVGTHTHAFIRTVFNSEGGGRNRGASGPHTQLQLANRTWTLCC